MSGFCRSGHKWFEANVWPLSNAPDYGYTLLYCRRPASSNRDAVARREGVGLGSSWM